MGRSSWDQDSNKISNSALIGSIHITLKTLRELTVGIGVRAEGEVSI